MQRNAIPDIAARTAISANSIEFCHAVVKLDAAGRPLQTLFDPDGSHVATVSAATEHMGRLFLGNLGGDYVSYLDLSAAGL